MRCLGIVEAQTKSGRWRQRGRLGLRWPAGVCCAPRSGWGLGWRTAPGPIQCARGSRSRLQPPCSRWISRITASSCAWTPPRPAITWR